MHIAIINGPNLNLIGKREPEIYGTDTFEDYFQKWEGRFPDIRLSIYQSNVEGELINEIQKEGFSADGIILNPGGYTHTSVAIGDAVAGVEAPVVEVHLSNIFAREEFRKVSFVSPHCTGVISGLGFDGYALAIEFLINYIKKSRS
jgi:3-dehydroquinate dehydratase-2